ncbi:unnamed protein product [Ambrosiozyma monospora]|uniref:Unnamed protein product n=1 Tax=Ambrosiozyma monospora TaxID=43982 RepID=A0ACB5TS19_AMBMO|nr:unnamed protein product [Ambrosiozyma monospora]
MSVSARSDLSRKPSSPMKKRSHAPTISSATAQLLTSTKALLKSLTAWASRTASVSDVSSRFVKVGDDFKALKKSYTNQGLDVSDVKDIPLMLRGVLEESLVLEPSQKTLDLFLPKVGQIVSELMRILKEKQAEAQKLEQKKEQPSRVPSSSNSHSTATGDAAHNTPPPAALKDPIAKLQSNQSLARRGSKRFSAYQTSKILSMHNTPLPDKIHSPLAGGDK